MRATPPQPHPDSRTPATAEDWVLADRYRLIEKIGEGGAAEIYRGVDQRLGRVVAIKLLRHQFLNEPSSRDRFLAEARAAAGLLHPNVVDVYDFGTVPGEAMFIAMRYIEGASLDRILAARGRLTPSETVAIALDVCEALHAAHEQGLIHRDVKPHNILIDGRGAVRLTDFGIAKALAAPPLTQTGVAFGTAAYISPEQATGGAVGPTSDIYSLGCTLYEMLAGTPPFSGETPASVAYMHVWQQPRPLREIASDVPEELEQIVMGCLAKEPDGRFTSAEWLASLLRAVPDAAPSDHAQLGALVALSAGEPAADGAPVGQGPLAEQGRFAALPSRPDDVPPAPPPVIAPPQPPERTEWAAPPPVGTDAPVPVGPPSAPIAASAASIPAAAATPVAGASGAAWANDGDGGGPADATVAAPLSTDAQRHRSTAAPAGAEGYRGSPIYALPSADRPRTAVVRGAATRVRGGDRRDRRRLPLVLVGLFGVALLALIAVELLAFSGLLARPSPTPDRIAAPGAVGSATPGASATVPAIAVASPNASAPVATATRAIATATPVRTARPTQTPEPTAAPTAAPTRRIATPQPTRVPVATRRPAPTATPRPAPTATPRPSPPAPAPATVTVRLEDATFRGGFTDDDGRYHGRTARWVYGQGTAYHTMTSTFALARTPAGEGRLSFVGIDAEGDRKLPIRVSVNGTLLYQGPDPLPNDFCCGPSGPGNWGTVTWRLREGLLRRGSNTVTLTLLDPSDRVYAPIFVMLDYATVTVAVR